MHRVSSCGSTIIYDSKNHKVWASKWTTKLRDDMKTVSPAADHAVLVTTVFPKGQHQGLLYRDGVMVVSPTRVIPVAHLMRRHALQTYALRLSNEQRTEKTTQLYVLLTSNQTAGLWERHSEALRSLVDIETWTANIKNGREISDLKWSPDSSQWSTKTCSCRSTGSSAAVAYHECPPTETSRLPLPIRPDPEATACTQYMLPI